MKVVSNQLVETKIMIKKLQKESNEDYKIIKKNHECIQDTDHKVKRLANLIKEKKKKIKSGIEQDKNLESKIELL